MGTTGYGREPPASAALFLIKRHEVTAKQGEGKMIGPFFAK